MAIFDGQVELLAERMSNTLHRRRSWFGVPAASGELGKLTITVKLEQFQMYIIIVDKCYNRLFWRVSLKVD